MIIQILSLLILSVSVHGGTDELLGFGNRISLNLDTLYDRKIHTCRINIQTYHVNGERDTHIYWPLALKPNELKFWDVHTNGDIFLCNGETIRLVCSGNENSFVNLGVRTIQAVCLRGDLFSVNGKEMRFKLFNCMMTPQSDDRVTSTTSHQIGFYIPFPNRLYQFLPLIYITHNPDTFQITQTSHRVLSISVKQNMNRQWMPGNHGVDQVDEFYSNYNNSMIRQLGIQRATRYFTDGSLIDIGHMAAFADFPFAAQQLATCFYMNTNPQFSGLNRNNWKYLEMSIRNIPEDVQVVTETEGILSLPNNNFNVALYLDIDDGRIPIPRIFVKHVYLNGLSYIFKGLNYPTIQGDDFRQQANEILAQCPHENCNGIDWLMNTLRYEENRMNPTRGYLFCCGAIPYPVI